MQEFKTPEEALAHFGVLGMRWGHHSSNLEGVSSKTNRQARNDAIEYARAKMFYGEGAGTRRKLINAQVEAKRNRDPAYAKAFDHHLSNQDMSTHASKARSERKRKDVAKGTAKTARGIKNVFTGNARYASLAAVMVAGGAMAAHRAGIDKVVLRAGKTALSKLRSAPKAGQSASAFLRNMGIS